MRRQIKTYKDFVNEQAGDIQKSIPGTMKKSAISIWNSDWKKAIGAYGPDTIQQVLNNIGYDVKVDGQIGDETLGALGHLIDTIYDLQQDGKIDLKITNM